MRPYNPWIFLVIGVLLLLNCALDLPESGGVYKGFPIPAFGGWILLAVGIILVAVAGRSILRGEGKERPPTEEEIRKAKEALENMHRHEHGTLPEYTGGLDELKDNNKK